MQQKPVQENVLRIRLMYRKNILGISISPDFHLIALERSNNMVSSEPIEANKFIPPCI